MKSILLFLVLALSSAAYGQLGGTKADLKARWGAGLDKGDSVMCGKTPFFITAEFWNGKCHHIKITKQGADSKSLGEFTPKEIDDFLAENPKGAKWAAQPEGLYRFTTDKQFRALVIAPIITIESVEYSKVRVKK